MNDTCEGMNFTHFT